MRIMTSPEAVGHVLAFSFWEKSVAVAPLPVHAPDDQTIVFEEGGEEEALVHRAKSKLVAFFQLCEDASLTGHPFQKKYNEVVKGYTWQTSSCSWKLKTREMDAIGRLAQCQHNSKNETFYIRLLLHTIAPTSFAHCVGYRPQQLCGGLPRWGLSKTTRPTASACRCLPSCECTTSENSSRES